MNENFADRLNTFIANEREHFGTTLDEVILVLEGAIETLEAEDIETSANEAVA